MTQPCNASFHHAIDRSAEFGYLASMLAWRCSRLLSRSSLRAESDCAERSQAPIPPSTWRLLVRSRCARGQSNYLCRLEAFLRASTSDLPFAARSLSRPGSHLLSSHSSTTLLYEACPLQPPINTAEYDVSARSSTCSDAYSAARDH